MDEIQTDKSTYLRYFSFGTFAGFLTEMTFEFFYIFNELPKCYFWNIHSKCFPL